jgi:hypothetical protein
MIFTGSRSNHLFNLNLINLNMREREMEICLVSAAWQLARVVLSWQGHNLELRHDNYENLESMMKWGWSVCGGAASAYPNPTSNTYLLVFWIHESCLFCQYVIISRKTDRKRDHLIPLFFKKKKNRDHGTLMVDSNSNFHRTSWVKIM